MSIKLDKSPKFLALITNETLSLLGIGLVLMLLSGFMGCTSKQGNAVPICNLPDSVSFKRDILPLFSANCNKGGCHTGPSPTGKLCLDAAVAYSQLTRKGSGYIDTLHPNYSVLYASMVSNSRPMPPSGKLDTCATALILKWIVQKAKNN